MDMPMNASGSMPMMHHKKHSMSSSYSLSLPMSRNSSGTSWQPDNSPMYMVMSHDDKGGMWMFHGSIFFRYNDQELFKTTSRGASKFDAPNWMMAMYSRPVGKNGLFSFSSMFSADILTMGKSGYPLLFQTGESYNNKPLVDRQHPHDLFAELAIAYTQRLNKNVDVFAYFGYPGEPALGAPAFMHRTAAMNNPDAPLSHHWQDATHITFGVATLGIRLNTFKVEISSFTGREPDENRYNFDKMRFDSYSYRISYNPNKYWAFQVSQGYIKSPEALSPDENVWRYTASALYSTPLSKQGNYFNASVAYGMNDEGGGHKENSILIEANQQFKKRALYARYEWVQKSSHELDIDALYGDMHFDIHALTIGTNQKVATFSPFDLLIGVQTGLHLVPQSLQGLYGSFPMSGEIYLQLRPRLSRMR
jgi:hypothetical protein